MKKQIFLTAFVFALVSEAFAEELHLTTEDYAPLNFEKDGKIVGIGADQVFEAMERGGVNYNVEMTKWSRALGLAKSEPNTCVFSAQHTADRDPHFLWIEPLLVGRDVLARLKDSNVSPKTLEEARKFSVGAPTGDSTIEKLEGLGFDKLDTAATQELVLKKLKAGRIDMVSGAESYLRALIASGEPLEIILPISETKIALACNKETDPGTIGKIQSALDQLIASGRQKEIISNYE